MIFKGFVYLLFLSLITIWLYILARIITGAVIKTIQERSSKWQKRTKQREKE